MKENECKSVHNKRRWLLLCTFSFLTTVIFEFFSEQTKGENFLRALFPLDDGLQKKVLLFAVCCCGVLSFRVSVVV
jgi:hypothetical protein